MLTKLEIRNFKRFDSVEIELGNPVVFIGPNNSGKTTALQALALWDLGLRRWVEKHGEGETPGKRPGVAINRRDFLAAPIPDANLLWHDLHVRDVRNTNDKQETSNIRIDVKVEGVTDGRSWACGFEFDYANAESFYCRPSRLSEDKNPERLPLPTEVKNVRVAYLPPMSGLADREFAMQPGQIDYLIGQGRTAEVLRNLCYRIRNGFEDGAERWNQLGELLNRLFGISVLEPELIAERAEIVMSYRDRRGVKLDLSCTGRGAQQTLLLLAYMTANPGAVLLLDEPDAHLEVLRQKEVYAALSESAEREDSQVIAASHSETLLNEAAGRDVVVAFVGQPHRIDDRASQVLKSLTRIGFDQYYQAELTGWVLYLEGSTDLAILQAFARTSNHLVQGALAQPFVCYVSNDAQAARDHFYGLAEAKPDLVGSLLCDRLDRQLQPNDRMDERMWRRREIENYLCQPATLRAYAEGLATEDLAEGPLFQEDNAARFRALMDECIQLYVPPVAYNDLSDPWWSETKASDGFLDRLFEAFFKKLGLPNLLRKTNYHRLARYVRPEDMDAEIAEVLDAIYRQSLKAQPRGRPVA